MDRGSEWFVPKRGTMKFRTAVGLLFLPYTGMVLSYTVMGSMLAEKILWRRVGAILIVYFFALGIGAHALDAIGSRETKPWGNVFSSRELWTAAILSLAVAYAIGVYYMVRYTPLLWIVAILEGFLLLAYNLEWFGGQFHTDRWFVFSWGFLPVLAGYVLQTNRLSFAALILAIAAGTLSHIEITVSRPYKAIKQLHFPSQEDIIAMKRYERILKNISFGTIMFGASLALWRWVN